MSHRSLYWNGIIFKLFACVLLSALLACKPSENVLVEVPIEQSKDSLPPAVILMIGDGMGLTQVSAALYSTNKGLNLEQFPIIGFHKTQSSSDLITDSAAGATAFACGCKTNNSFIGMNADTVACKTLVEKVQDVGMATGLIATSSIVHATPASFAAHQPMRIYYEDIALDMTSAGLDLMIGGGKRYFDRRKNDDRDLVAELQARGYIVRDYISVDLDKERLNPAYPFVYFTADNHPLPVNQGRNYLSYASLMGADYLDKRGDAGFFLMIEGSQIDWANHAKEGRLAIEETRDFDRAIGEILTFAKRRGNTLVIVTADHECGGMAVTGKKRGRVKVDFTTNGHTASLVPVYAFGPGAEMFSGIYENTEIHDKILKFLNLEDLGISQSP